MKKWLYVVLAFGLLPGWALADSIFVGSDQGVDFTLQHSESGGVHAVNLMLDTSGYAGPGTHLHAISLKLFSSLDLNNITVIDLPGADTDWSLFLGQANANTTFAKGNQLGNGSGFFSEIFTANAGGQDVPGGVLNFAWTFAGPGLQFQPQPIFKAVFVDDGFRKSGNITEVVMQPPAAVPEPTSLSLLGTGMVGIAAITRRRNNRRRRKQNLQQVHKS